MVGRELSSGWVKIIGMLKKVKLRGREKVSWLSAFVGAAYDLYRPSRLQVQTAGGGTIRARADCRVQEIHESARRSNHCPLIQFEAMVRLKITLNPNFSTSCQQRLLMPLTNFESWR